MFHIRLTLYHLHQRNMLIDIHYMNNCSTQDILIVIVLWFQLQILSFVYCRPHWFEGEKISQIVYKINSAFLSSTNHLILIFRFYCVFYVPFFVRVDIVYDFLSKRVFLLLNHSECETISFNHNNKAIFQIENLKINIEENDEIFRWFMTCFFG